MRRLLRWSAVLTALAFGRAAAAVEGTVDADFGHQISVLTTGKLSLNRLYGQIEAKGILDRDPETGDTWELVGGVRGVIGQGEEEVSIRAMSIARVLDKMTFRLGFQEVSWGENLGYSIADLVNPRDLRDPLLIDTWWSREPVFMANYQLTLGWFRAQALATPFPRTTQIPDSNAPLSLIPPAYRAIPLNDPPDFPVDHYGRDAELGARVGATFQRLDVSLFYLWHWNRTPVFEAQVTPTSASLDLVQRRVHSTGIGFNYALDDFVVRGDGVLHLGDPHQGTTPGRAPVGPHVQTVLGGDYTNDSHLVIGAQYQFDWTSDWSLHWVAAHVAKGFFDETLEPELFVFRGVGNEDTWIRPQITWRFLGAASISARADLLWASDRIGRGRLTPFDGVDRFFVWSRVTL